MDKIEQEIHKLREEVTTLQGELEKFSTLVALMAVAQNPPQFQQRPQQQYQQQYQRQPRQQAPQQFAPQNRVQRAPQYDPIPMKYAELLPVLLEKNLVQKTEVQKLIRANILSFKDLNVQVNPLPNLVL